MSHSEKIDEICKAIAAVQNQVQPLVKDTPNPFFKSQYADLAQVIEKTRPLMAEHGLMFMQVPGSIAGKWTIGDHSGEHTPVLTTTLFHMPSGQWFRSELQLMMVGLDPQKQGSAITYARRYTQISMLGLIVEDDDGQAASQPDRYKAKKTEQMRQPNDAHKKQDKITISQIITHGTKLGWKPDKVKAFLADFYQNDFNKLLPDNALTQEELIKGLAALKEVSAPKEGYQREPYEG